MTTAATTASGVADARIAVRSVRSGRFTVLVAALAIALVVVTILSLGMGQNSLSPTEVIGVILQRLGITTSWVPDTPGAEGTIFNVRLPRIVMGILVGAALAAAGVVMQAIFGNPLADAAVVGVSSGAALGAAASITFGAAMIGTWTTPLAAFVGGLAAVFAVYAVSRSGGRTEVVTLLLTGIAVNAICGAGLALMTFIGTTSTREQIVFWQLGSLNGSLWQNIIVVLPLAVIGIAAALVMAPRLDLFALGERTARHLGVRVEALRITAIVVVALLVCAAVSFAGIIAFVGLVIPHLMRMAIGPAHLPLTIVSVLGGAVLLASADLIARTAVPLADMPIGMITSLVGGPFFLWLLLRTRRTSGGWG